MPTDKKKISMDPSCVIAMLQIAVNPAAGPLTLNGDLLIKGMIMPPMIPAQRPESTGAPDAREIPRQSGKATKKTVMLALRSCRKNVRK